MPGIISARLRRLIAGDIIHAASTRVGSIICLIESVDDDVIRARRITTQEKFAFSVQTGIDLDPNDSSPARIDSVAPVPYEIYGILMGIERRFRIEDDPEKARLKEVEIYAFVYIDSFFAKNRINYEEDASDLQ